MTTYELAERLARRLTPQHVAKLTMAEVFDVIEAINSGSQACYDILPAWNRRTTVAISLEAPALLNLQVTNGEVILGGSGDQFTEAQIGRSVVVDGDTNWNEVQSTSKLLDAYLGSTGAKAARVYCDSFWNDVGSFDGLASRPYFADTRESLELFNARAAELPGEIGKPRYYWMEMAAPSLGAMQQFFIRFFPAPAVAYSLRADMEFRPLRLVYANIQQATTIPLAEHFIENGLLPLCEERLMRSPVWRDQSIRDLVVEDARRARAFLANQRPTTTIPQNRVGTPLGF